MKNKGLIFAFVGIGVGCFLCLLFIGIAVLLGVQEANNQKERLDNATETSIRDLINCTNDQAGEVYKISGYFQTPSSLFCFGTCDLDFAVIQDQEDSEELEVEVDLYDEGALSSENTVSFPSTYETIASFTFRLDDDTEVSGSEEMTITGELTYNEATEDQEAFCSLKVERITR